MANINGLLPGKHLKAADLQGRHVSVVMHKVEVEKVGNDNKPVLYFQGKERGLVLNKTNANAISEAYGPETNAWAGQPVTLFEAMVDFQGKSVQAIRVRPGAAAVPGQSAQQPPQQPAYQPGGQPGYAPAAGYTPPPQQQGGYATRQQSFQRDAADEIPF